MSLNKRELTQKIIERKAKISVVGLGYVGLNIACLFAQQGFLVYGFDIDREKLAKLKRKENYIPEEEWLTPIISECVDSRLLVSSNIEDAAILGDFIMVAVTTDAGESGVDYSYLLQAIRAIAGGLHQDNIVVVESTIEPGTTENVVQPILENKSGLKVGADIGLVFSPERIDSGNRVKTIRNLPKVIGGVDSVSTEIVSLLYSQVIDRVIPVSSPRVAEMAKVMENTQRDVNIALTNLFAQAADKLGIDIEEVLEAAATKWNFMRLKPGCGVGGQCMGDVTYMAINSMRQSGLDCALLQEARRINESMPSYTVRTVMMAMESAGKDISKSRVAVLGIAYKGDSSDTRNSPALEVISLLEQSGAKVVAYDPFVKAYAGVECCQTLEQALSNCDCVVIATEHSQFKNLELGDVIIIDGRNILPKRGDYRGIGRQHSALPSNLL